MDFSSDYATAAAATTLPYDDFEVDKGSSTTIAAATDSITSGRSLANRIGSTKVYLLSDASKSRGGKRKRDDEDAPDDVDMDEGDSPYRDNAIFLQGSPISHLPTSNILAYATHFDARILGLEWVDDRTCVLVFESKADARSAFRLLQKSLAEEPSFDDSTVTAKPIPMTIWPAEHRINATLGQGDGLKGILRMRWARVDDVKKRNARETSEFYKKYGEHAGKTFEDGPPLSKRRRPDERTADDAMERARLDAELDMFLAENVDDAPPPSPPSKMRSDYIAQDGKTLLERTSAMRAHSANLEDRPIASLPRRARGRRGEDEWDSQDRYSGSHSRGGRGERERTRNRRPPRPKPTQEDLDAELDAFLKRD